ncbi:MAG: hypothetical protein K2K14_00665 [Ruminococcus sp.]|nr:hypothetical protein [Ruminococcus sp.]
MNNGFVSILISVIISIGLSGGVSMYLFNKFGVNSENYKSLMKFARKGKNIKDYPEILENLEKRISELENDVVNSHDSSEIMYIQNELNSHRDAIQTLAKAVGGLKPNESEQTAEILKLISERISLLEKKINTEISGIYSNTETSIDNIEQQISDLQNTVSKQNKVITELTRIINEMRQNTAANTVPSAPEVSPKQNVPADRTGTRQVSEPVQKAVIPNETYVKYLIRELKGLDGILGAREYNYCMEKLEEILQDGDFDDSEDIMQSVHEALKKYIYGSDTKVKNSDWKLLEEYLLKAGYEPVQVKSGDRIRDYAIYFENVIPASDAGEQGTIKLITQKPYIITYLDNGVKGQFKLCGKCTAYK